MVVKKKILSELKDFNKELDEHIASEDLDFVSSIDSSNFLSEHKDSLSEMAPIFSSNLTDIKTEMNLLRKNLIDSVSGITNRLLKEQNEQVKSYLSNFSSQMIIEFKSTISNLLVELTSNMDNFSERFSIFEKEKNELVAKIDSLHIDLQGLQNLNKIDFIAFKNEIKSIINKKDSNLKDMEQEIRELKLYMEKMNNSFQSFFTEVIADEKQINKILIDNHNTEIKSKSLSKIVENPTKSIKQNYSDQTKLNIIEQKLKKLDLLKNSL